MVSHSWPVANTDASTEYLAMKPISGGTPASENMNRVITSAKIGLRLPRPLKSASSSASKPLRASNMITPKVPRVVNT